MALIEIDGLPNLKMVDLSMANCECHNQMVTFAKQTWRFPWDCPPLPPLPWPHGPMALQKSKKSFPTAVTSNTKITSWNQIEKPPW
jgi:hypothetical protein